MDAAGVTEDMLPALPALVRAAAASKVRDQCPASPSAVVRCRTAVSTPDKLAPQAQEPDYDTEYVTK